LIRNKHGQDEETTGEEETNQNPPVSSTCNLVISRGNDSKRPRPKVKRLEKPADLNEKAMPDGASEYLLT
jgi:hypothetical protein